MTPTEPDRPTAAGGTDPKRGVGSEEEPVTTGTLFLTMVILTLIGAMWAVAYYLLLHR